MDDDAHTADALAMSPRQMSAFPGPDGIKAPMTGIEQPRPVTQYRSFTTGHRRAETRGRRNVTGEPKFVNRKLQRSTWGQCRTVTEPNEAGEVEPATDYCAGSSTPCGHISAITTSSFGLEAMSSCVPKTSMRTRPRGAFSRSMLIWQPRTLQ